MSTASHPTVDRRYEFGTMDVLLNCPDRRIGDDRIG